MKFEKCHIQDAYIITIEELSDERGFFSRAFDKKQFLENGLNTEIVQCNISYSKFKGAFHGLHYQIPPYDEEKMVRCTRGKIFDVIVDTRKKSTTYKKWFGIELSHKNHRTLYVPRGCAHGFVTLEDDTEVFYQNTQIFSHEHERGVRWDDPMFQIKWPIKPIQISQKDSCWEHFKE